MEEGRESMGQRFKRLREQARFSQSELSRKTGIPPGTIKNWEQDRRIPRLDHAALVARALSITLDELAGDLGGPLPSETQEKPKRKSKK
jgi:transcriptional regulator with XRE-family HTH domain